MAMNNKNKSARSTRFSDKKKMGFTLIEILVIVAIITILISIALSSLLGNMSQAQDNSAFTSFKSIAAPAFMCLTSGASLTAYDPAASICSNPAAAIGSDWPNFSKYGWEDFYWCDINAPIGAIPSTGAYDGVNFGGNNSAGKFCFILKKGTTKSMWCTVEGCKKDGF